VRGSRLYATTNDAPCRPRCAVYTVNLPRMARSWLVVARSYRTPSRLPVYTEPSRRSSPPIIIQEDSLAGSAARERERERQRGLRFVHAVFERDHSNHSDHVSVASRLALTSPSSLLVQVHDACTHVLMFRLM